MSYSSDIKKELSKINNFKNVDLIDAEFLGYILTGNIIENQDKIEFITENEFNIERFYKILFNLNIDYEPEKIGKNYKAIINRCDVEKRFSKFNINTKDEITKSIIRGAFLGAGSVTDPKKAYHLEILFGNKENSEYILNLCKTYGIILKIIEYKEKFMLYIKDGEEISKFLACIGANKAVLEFEDIRIYKEMKNNVNRIVNCETANLNKTVNAAVDQIEDILFLKKINKFEDMPIELQEIANLRLNNPDATLKELGQMLFEPIGKSGANHRMKKISNLAKENRI